MNKNNWKDYINTILLGIVCYLIVDMHNSFKQVVKDVEYLKETVKLHDYLLNSSNKNKNKKTNDYSASISEAILPNNSYGIKKENNKTKHSYI